MNFRGAWSQGMPEWKNIWSGQKEWPQLREELARWHLKFTPWLPKRVNVELAQKYYGIYRKMINEEGKNSIPKEQRLCQGKFDAMAAKVD